MNRNVLGKNAIFSMYIAGTPYPVFCAKTFEKSLNQDKIEVTSVNSGVDREFVPGMSDAQITATGITQVNNDEGKISIFYLEQRKRDINSFRILCTDQDGTIIIVTFSGFLINSTLGKETTAWSQSSVTFQITGSPTFSTVIPAPGTPICEEQPTIYTTLPDGVAYVESPLLKPGAGQTITILHVSRSGTTYYEVIGTPGNLAFAYTVVGANGRITFQNPGNPATPPFSLEPVSIEYKIEV